MDIIKVKKIKSPNNNYEEEKHLLPVIQEGDRIPKIIHQTFPDRKYLPQEVKENIEKIKAGNHGWEYRLYDDQDIITFIQENYGKKILSYYLRINSDYGAARSDLFRYLCIYQYGGVYIDIKSTLDKPLDKVIHPDDRFLLSQWNNKADEQFEGWGMSSALNHVTGGEFQQWHIVAIKGHPFLRAVIKSVLRNIAAYDPFRHGVGFQTLWSITGPIAYTLAIVPILNLHSHRFLDITAEAGFQYSIYPKGQGKSHQQLFKHHYTSIYKPLVKINFFKKVLWESVYFARNLQPLFRKQ